MSSEVFRNAVAALTTYYDEFEATKIASVLAHGGLLREELMNANLGERPEDSTPLTREVARATGKDMVNSPGHYTQHRKGIECIDVIEDFNSPNLANVVKYAWRVDSGGKWDDIEDLDKLIWYAKREKARRTGVQQVAGRDERH